MPRQNIRTAFDAPNTHPKRIYAGDNELINQIIADTPVAHQGRGKSTHERNVPPHLNPTLPRSPLETAPPNGGLNPLN